MGNTSLPKEVSSLQWVFGETQVQWSKLKLLKGLFTKRFKKTRLNYHGTLAPVANLNIVTVLVRAMKNDRTSYQFDVKNSFPQGSRNRKSICPHLFAMQHRVTAKSARN